MAEKRNTDRVETSIAGLLISDKLNLPCTILDVSATGARIQLQPGMFLPKQITLRAREWGNDRAVHVVWRNKTQIGVCFSA